MHCFCFVVVQEGGTEEWDVYALELTKSTTFHHVKEETNNKKTLIQQMKWNILLTGTAVIIFSGEPLESGDCFVVIVAQE